MGGLTPSHGCSWQPGTRAPGTAFPDVCPLLAGEESLRTRDPSTGHSVGQRPVPEAVGLAWVLQVKGGPLTALPLTGSALTGGPASLSSHPRNEAGPSHLLQPSLFAHSLHIFTIFPWTLGSSECS